MIKYLQAFSVAFTSFKQAFFLTLKNADKLIGKKEIDCLVIVASKEEIQTVVAYMDFLTGSVGEKQQEVINAITEFNLRQKFEP